VLTALGFADGFLAADAVPRALEFKPIGLEGFDGLLVDFMLRKQLAINDVSLLPSGRGFLLVEMGSWDAAEAQAKAEALVRAAQSWPEKPTARIYNAQDAAAVWHVRESSLGATVAVPGDSDRFEGWDDAGIPPARLGAYLRQLTDLMSEYGYTSPLYGHYGQGCVHLRINFDFRTEKGLRRFREFLDRAADLVLSFGGSLSGEHGDGQARAALLPKMFGPELIEAFQEFKALWDPDNRMNPGKLIDAVRVYDPVENLRHLRSDQPPAAGPSQKEGAESGSLSTLSAAKDGLETHFVFASDGGSLERATARCVGVGACLNTKGGSMCPSYRATGEEQNSTRGRARLLWEMLAGALRKEGFESKAVHESLDLCLSCKACKSECPVQVDMTAYKSEFLAQRYKHRLHPLHHYVFGFSDLLARLGSITPALTNLILSSRLTSPIVKRIVGVAPEREMPMLAAKTYRSSRVAVETANVPRPSSGQTSPRPEGQLAPPQVVLLWPDTWNNYYHPQTLLAAERVLRKAGFRVQIPKSTLCCGRALYDFGLLGAARSYLVKILDRMAPEIDSGMPFIFLEPSCASIFKDEALQFFPNDARAQKLSQQVWLLSDWLAAKAPEWVNGRLAGKQAILHGHCHHKAVFGGPVNEIALLKKAGATVEMIDAPCCGMAGPFGFEADKFELSKAIAALGLLPAVNSAAPETIIVADGFSCREQIEQLGHREGLHFAEVLARTIAK
jgi:Fe-S oxidoreductase